MIVDDLKISILNACLYGNFIYKNIDKLKDDINYRDDNYPSDWKLVRIGDVIDIARGGSPRPIKNFLTNDENGINWIKIGDTEKGSKYINSCKEKIIKEGMKKSRYVHKGDFLLSNSMSFGRPYILNIDGCIHDGWLVLTDKNNLFNKDFLFYVLSSDFVYRQFCDKASGAVVSNLNTDKVRETIIPLPPIKSQKELVKKIDLLFSKLAEVKPIEQELQRIKSDFSSKMKNSIINFGIKGKLTKQNVDDNSILKVLETIDKDKINLIKTSKFKQEKGFKESTDFDKPFDIPNNWQFRCLNELIIKKIDNRGKTPAFSSIKGNDIELLEINSLQEDGSIDRSVCKKYITNNTYNSLRDHIKEKDLLIATVGSIGKIGYMDEIVSGIAQNIIGIRCHELINSKYIFYVLKSPYFFQQMNSIKMEAVQASVKVPNLLNLMIPLPPVEEQNRIVEKIERLLPICNDIEKLVNS